MSRFAVLATLVATGCGLLGTCPGAVEPLESGTYAMTDSTWGERFDVEQATATYDRDAGELTVTYVDEDGAEVIHELDVGPIFGQEL